MKLPKFAITKDHKIWQPRWRDRCVLIAKYKVGKHNVIVFTNAPSLKGEWYASRETIEKYKTEEMQTKNGSTITVYPVPLDELIVYEGREV